MSINAAVTILITSSRRRATDVRIIPILTCVCGVNMIHIGQSTLRLVQARRISKLSAAVGFSCCVFAELLTAYRYWMYGWDWGNLAVIVGEHFDHIKCTSRTSGVDVEGWHCIFQQMPHVCTFRTIEVRTSSQPFPLEVATNYRQL